MSLEDEEVARAEGIVYAAIEWADAGLTATGWKSDPDAEQQLRDAVSLYLEIVEE